MSTKISTIVITLMAACSFASVVAPGASAEQKQGSGSYDCAAGKTWFDTRVGDYEKLKDTNGPAAGDAKKDAENEKTRAKEAGCDVSTWKVPARTVINRRLLMLKQITVAAPVTAPSRTVVSRAPVSVALG